MSHGQRAERGGRPCREYWSRRLGSPRPWGRDAKHETHRRERRYARRLCREQLQRMEVGDGT